MPLTMDWKIEEKEGEHTLKFESPDDRPHENKLEDFLTQFLTSYKLKEKGSRFNGDICERGLFGKKLGFLFYSGNRASIHAYTQDFAIDVESAYNRFVQKG